MSNITFAIEENLTPQLIKEWNDLWTSSDNSHYFNSFNWFQTCMKIEYSEKVAVLVGRNGLSVVLIMPFFITQGAKGLYLKNPGGKYIDRSAFLSNSYDQQLITKAIEYLKTDFSFTLPEITEEFKSEIESHDFLTIKEASKNYYLPFGSSPYKYLDKEQKRKILKVLRENSHLIRFEMNKGNLQDLSTCIEIDLKSYKSNKGIVTFKRKSEINFFRELILNNGECVKINILYFKNAPIAYEIGIQTKDVYYGLNKSFDNNFSYLFPGKIVAYLLTGKLFSDGIQTFDFCRGEDMLKKSFTPYSKTQYNVYYIKNTLARKFILSYASFKNFVISSPRLYLVYKKTRANFF